MNLGHYQRPLAWLLAGVWLAFAPLCSARGQSAADGSPSAVQVTDVSVGLAGHLKVGHWAEVRVTFTNSSPAPLVGQLTLSTEDGDGLRARFTAPRAETLAPGETTIARLVKFGRAGGDLQVEFREHRADGDIVLVAHTVRGADLGEAFGSTSELVVTLGTEVDVASALDQRSYRIRRETHSIVVAFADLPQHALGWDAVDAAVLPTSELSADEFSETSRTAFAQWILLGGRAILSVGQAGEQIFGDDGLLSALAPGEFTRVAPQRRTAALESYAGSVQRLDDGSRRTSLEQTLFATVRGRVEVAEGTVAEQTQPLVIHYPVGLGQVSLLTVDLDRPPVSNWAGRANLLARMLGAHQAGETGRGQQRDLKLPAQLGYQDLSGQLRMALEQFSGTSLVSFSLVALLVAAYILLIGPGDYFLLKYAVRRMQATWFTLALITLGCFALAWWLNTRLKSPSIALNQAEVIDIDLATGLARGSVWTHLYSPTTSAYNFTPQIELAGAVEQSPSLAHAGGVLAWQGLPGRGLGGLDGRAAPTLFELPYDITTDVSAAASPPAIFGIPIQAAATRSFVTRWWQPVNIQFPSTLAINQDGLLHGQFEYALDLELEDCVLFYDNWLYRIPGPMQRGRVVEISAFDTGRNLQWHLTQKHVIDAKDIITPWNARDHDAARILEIMMFHKEAGGDSYTGLTNRYYSWLDLSDHLHTGRAILIGRAPRRATTLVDEELPDFAERYDHSWTVYRILLPVGGPL
jgi:hypothetical protein